LQERLHAEPEHAKPGMQIRPAVSADLPRLKEISLASFGPITWQRAVDRIFGPLNGLDWRDRWRRRVEKAFAEQTILVLEEEGKILGYACGSVDSTLGLGHIDILAVDPPAQGKGYGRRLLRAIEEYFRAQGATHVQLESLSDNETANRLYIRDGYQQLASHINWFKKIG
jgi:ribosomal protein S18 acetylase RimI-like enzyme